MFKLVEFLVKALCLLKSTNVPASKPYIKNMSGYIAELSNAAIVPIIKRILSKQSDERNLNKYL